MSQWGEERRFLGNNCSIIVLPCVDTEGTFAPIVADCRIESLHITHKDGSAHDIDELFERCSKRYVGRPYSEWQRPGPPRPLPQNPPVSPMRREPPPPPSDLNPYRSPDVYPHRPMDKFSNAGILETIPCRIRQMGSVSGCVTNGCLLTWNNGDPNPPKCPRIAVQQARRSAGYPTTRPGLSPALRGFVCGVLWMAISVAASAAGWFYGADIATWFWR